jgi:hypothetical protein
VILATPSVDEKADAKSAASKTITVKLSASAVLPANSAPQPSIPLANTATQKETKAVALDLSSAGSGLFRAVMSAADSDTLPPDLARLRLIQRRSATPPSIPTFPVTSPSASSLQPVAMSMRAVSDGGAVHSAKDEALPSEVLSLRRSLSDAVSAVCAYNASSAHRSSLGASKSSTLPPPPRKSLGASHRQSTLDSKQRQALNSAASIAAAAAAAAGAADAARQNRSSSLFIPSAPGAAPLPLHPSAIKLLTPNSSQHFQQTLNSLAQQTKRRERDLELAMALAADRHRLAQERKALEREKAALRAQKEEWSAFTAAALESLSLAAATSDPTAAASADSAFEALTAHAKAVASKPHHKPS